MLARLFGGPGTKILTEDPVYRGLLKVFSRSGADLVGVPVDEYGLDVDALETALQRHHPKLLLVTPAFQNPTGATLPIERRERIVALAHRHRCVLVESDIYSELRYSGLLLPTLKQLDAHGDVILLRSYSKIGFPGLRVGWVLAPRPLIARLADLKECSDLHSDQLAQAILLRFAQTGELSSHVKKIRLSGAERLAAAIEACRVYLPYRTRVTRPEGGPNLWVELPAPLTAERLLMAAQDQGVSFLPGSYFSLNRSHERCLRLSFGALTCGQIGRGIQILGQIAERELAAEPATGIDLEPAVALV